MVNTSQPTSPQSPTPSGTQPHPSSAGTESAPEIPLWLLAMSWMIFFGTLGLFGITTYLYPLEAFPTASDGAEFPIQFMAIRHVAFALPLAHGIVTRNRTILGTMYRIFWVMALLDVVTLYWCDYYIPFVGPDVLSRPVTGLLAAAMFLLPMTAAVKNLSHRP